MLILAIETSGSVGGVALLRSGELLGEVTVASRQTHSRRLLVTIEWLMDRVQVQWSDIQTIAVSLGPGSFTGLRIGLSTGKGLAFARGISIAGIPTLDALASHVTPCVDELVCPVLDARKGQVYTAVYGQFNGSALKRLTPYRAISSEALAEMVPFGPKVHVLGDIPEACRRALEKGLGGAVCMVPAHLSHVRAASVGMLAHARMRDGHCPDDIRLLKPLYIRASEAEELKNARNAEGSSP